MHKIAIMLLLYLPIFDCVGFAVEIYADFYDWQVGEGEARWVVFQVYLIHRSFSRFVQL